MSDRSTSLQRFKGEQNGADRGSIAAVFADIGVADGAGGVEDEDRWARRQVSVRLVSVEDSIAVYDDVLRVMQGGERRGCLARREECFFGGFSGDEQNRHTQLLQFLMMLVQLPELPPAGWSPVTTVKENEDWVADERGE